MSGMMITNSPGEVVASGQADQFVPKLPIREWRIWVPRQNLIIVYKEQKNPTIGGLVRKQKLFVMKVELNNIIILDVYQLRTSSIE